MARWRRFLILALFLSALGGILAALVFEELAYIASAKPASNRQSDNHSDHNRNKQEWSSQLAVATDWLTERREWLNVLFAGLVALFTLTLSRATSQLSAFASIQAGDMQNLLSVAKDNAAASASQVKAIEAQERVMREQACAFR